MADLMIDAAGVLTRRHRYWFANRGWLACECGKPLKDANGRGIHMPEGVAQADAVHARHTDREVCTCVDHLPPVGMPFPACPVHRPTDRENRSAER